MQDVLNTFALVMVLVLLLVFLVLSVFGICVMIYIEIDEYRKSRGERDQQYTEQDRQEAPDTWL